jgi:competence protein ComEA
MGKVMAGFLGIVLLAWVGAGVASPAYGFEARDQLNINTATVDELGEVPGMGTELAKSIVAYRKEHGPFASVDDLLKVKGMDKEKFEAVRMYLTVETQTHLE